MVYAQFTPSHSGENVCLLMMMLYTGISVLGQFVALSDLDLWVTNLILGVTHHINVIHIYSYLKINQSKLKTGQDVWWNLTLQVWPWP